MLLLLRLPSLQHPAAGVGKKRMREAAVLRKLWLQLQLRREREKRQSEASEVAARREVKRLQVMEFSAPSVAENYDKLWNKVALMGLRLALAP